MFKIVGQLTPRNDKTVTEYLIADNSLGYSIENRGTMDITLRQFPENGIVEVGSLFNYATEKVTARTCITKKDGSLTARGIAPVEIVDMLAPVESSGIVRINGENLGKALLTPMRIRLAKDIKGITHGKGVYLDSDGEEDVIALYLPKIDFLHFLPVGGKIGRVSRTGSLDYLTELKWLASEIMNPLYYGGQIFKLGGVVEDNWLYTKGEEGIGKNGFFIYGLVYPNSLFVIDLQNMWFPLSRLIYNLEKNHLIKEVPSLLGITSGRLAERPNLDEMYGVEIFSAFRQMYNIKLDTGYIKNGGMLRGVGYSNAHDYSVESTGNGFKIRGYSMGSKDLKYEGMLTVEAGMPVVRVKRSNFIYDQIIRRGKKGK